MVHVCATITLALSTIGSAAVIISILVRRKFSIKERIPFYLGLDNLCYSVFHLTDHIYSIRTAEHLPHNFCVVFGGMAYLFLGTQLMFR